MPVPALEPLLGLDEDGTRRAVEVERRQPLDSDEAVSGLASPFRVREVRDERIDGRRVQAERSQAISCVGLGHRPGKALALNRSTRQLRSAAIARSLRSGFTATA